jgi:hypothetical protein
MQKSLRYTNQINLVDLHYFKLHTLEILSKMETAMKKLLLGTLISSTLICLTAQAQQQAGGVAATTTTVGGISTTVIAATAVGLGLAGAIASNSSGTPQVAEPVDPDCGAGEVLVDGQCAPSTTVTTTVVTSPTVTTPVTVTVTTTTL